MSKSLLTKKTLIRSALVIVIITLVSSLMLSLPGKVKAEGSAEVKLGQDAVFEPYLLENYNLYEASTVASPNHPDKEAPEYWWAGCAGGNATVSVWAEPDQEGYAAASLGVQFSIQPSDSGLTNMMAEISLKITYTLLADFNGGAEGGSADAIVYSSMPGFDEIVDSIHCSTPSNIELRYKTSTITHQIPLTAGQTYEVYSHIYSYADTYGEEYGGTLSTVTVEEIRIHFDQPPVALLWGVAYCPVDLEITDPEGSLLTKQESEILGATYSEMDIDNDGDLDDAFYIPEPKTGSYFIQVLPELGASPGDTYSLQVGAYNQTIMLAENIPISEIPEQPYVIQSAEGGINAAPIADANGPYLGAKETLITFDSSGSHDPDGTIISYSWDFGDGSSGTGASVNHSYTAAGLYNAVLTVTDAGAQSTDGVLVVVYDPGAGFATGSGWINSPPGAYTPEDNTDPDLLGKATFGFVSKYKKGATTPTGVTEFQFKVADLNFHSDSYQWLVIAGAKAIYKGVGTINGEGNYGFMLSAIDAGLTPQKDDVDTFRIKIWDKDNGDTVVYDNQLGASEDANPTKAIAGGSIVIHK